MTIICISVNIYYDAKIINIYRTYCGNGSVKNDTVVSLAFISSPFSFTLGLEFSFHISICIEDMTPSQA